MVFETLLYHASLPHTFTHYLQFQDNHDSDFMHRFSFSADWRAAFVVWNGHSSILVLTTYHTTIMGQIINNTISPYLLLHLCGSILRFPATKFCWLAGSVTENIRQKSIKSRYGTSL